MVYVAHDKEEDGMKEMLTEFGVPIPALKFGEWEDIELLTKQLPDRVTVPSLPGSGCERGTGDLGRGCF